MSARKHSEQGRPGGCPTRWGRYCGCQRFVVPRHYVHVCQCGAIHNSPDLTATPADPVGELEEWGWLKVELDSWRGPLIVAAYQAGEHRIAVLARAAGITRDTVYRDLRAAGITFAPAARGRTP